MRASLLCLSSVVCLATPLGLWQWIVPGIGAWTISWPALGVAVAWLFAIDWRTRNPSPSSPSPALFDLVQAALAVMRRKAAMDWPVVDMAFETALPA